MHTIFRYIGRRLACYLNKETHVNIASPPSDPHQLKDALLPGDVLLVEGTTRISGAIKFITHSTWSHSAIYVGTQKHSALGNQENCLVEADMLEGVRFTSLEKYIGSHTRICRPIGLNENDKEKLIEFLLSKIGMQYDLKNIVDLARYFLPNPPIPHRFRRQLLELGSGDPTRAICSTLIAQAFESIKYPILPYQLIKSRKVAPVDVITGNQFKPLHSSFITPRDFDVSPYFVIVKPTVDNGFNFHRLEWI